MRSHLDCGSRQSVTTLSSTAYSRPRALCLCLHRPDRAADALSADSLSANALSVSHSQVKFLTITGTQHRFNPNLYECGKVCLSLLGTWAGPGWVPGTSTFLQVLVSIQSMIFCADPFYNEPGWAGMPKSKSDAHNRTLHVHTARRAILAPLKNPDARPHSVFKSVLDLHWRNKRDVIKRQLSAWNVDAATAKEVRDLLDALEPLEAA